MSTTRQNRKKLQDTAAWWRAELVRRRRAIATARQQRRDGIDALARESGLHPVPLPSLADAMDELMVPCL